MLRFGWNTFVLVSVRCIQCRMHAAATASTRRSDIHSERQRQRRWNMQRASNLYAPITCQTDATQAHGQVLRTRVRHPPTPTPTPSTRNTTTDPTPHRMSDTRSGITHRTGTIPRFAFCPTKLPLCHPAAAQLRASTALRRTTNTCVSAPVLC
jgi:hypothetical protein